MTIRRLSILGFGLLGASIARAVRSHIPDCHIKAYDLNRASISLHDADERFGEEDGVARACGDADFIIIAVPPACVGQLLQDIRSAVPNRAVVTDVTSTKRSVVDQAVATLKNSSRFVGGHPMAGGERSGSAAARADLFRGARVVLTPIASTDPQAVNEVESFWRTLGAQPMQLSPEAHDQYVAEISHLPHAVAAALVHLTGDASRAITGSGFRDLTRIAAGDPAMWQQILLDNADEVRAASQRLQAELRVFDSLLVPADPGKLERWLLQAAVIRRAMETLPGLKT